jgi:hypothetical protein
MPALPENLAVGDELTWEVPNPEEEYAEVVVDPSGRVHLLLFFPQFDATGEAGMAGRVRFAALTARRLLTLGFRLGDDFGWSFVGYHRSAADEPLPVAGADGAIPVTLVAVDVPTSTVKAVRAGVWPAGFSKAVSNEIARQQGDEIDETERAQRLLALYGAYPTTQKLLSIALTRCDLADG